MLPTLMRIATLVLLSLLLSLTLASRVAAHEIHLQVSPAPASLIQLQYADGQPFAFEAYELYPGNADSPAQVGRTDAQGRVAFLPGDTREWRLKAHTADGHGVDQRFQVAPADSTATTGPAPGLDHFSRLILGFSLILGGFGLYQFFACRKKKTRP
ncbi:MAG: hypothetical protein WBH99_12425 [Azovibrio sp.]|uniref:hypothetical protein n=1 Tax=Azovibrio sp. TaxID=1872673 RepID=UPI003C74C9B4